MKKTRKLKVLIVDLVYPVIFKNFVSSQKFLKCFAVLLSKIRELAMKGKILIDYYRTKKITAELRTKSLICLKLKVLTLTNVYFAGYL